MTALYIGGMGSRERNYYTRLVLSYGFEEAAERVQELYLDGRKEEAKAALPEELLETVCLCGSPGTVKTRLAAYADAGVDTLLVNPIAPTLAERVEQLQTLAGAT
jgi:alkanesulfonate monooxygenase SsuD/methylene tetrahydromethanopterin reductase-like flavin-dependent oxidoreductase (luciferase family)